jgi:hypothetical protein
VRIEEGGAVTVAQHVGPRSVAPGSTRRVVAVALTFLSAVLLGAGPAHGSARGGAPRVDATERLVVTFGLRAQAGKSQEVIETPVNHVRLVLVRGRTLRLRQRRRVLTSATVRPGRWLDLKLVLDVAGDRVELWSSRKLIARRRGRRS